MSSMFEKDERFFFSFKMMYIYLYAQVDEKASCFMLSFAKKNKDFESSNI